MTRKLSLYFLWLMTCCIAIPFFPLAQEASIKEYNNVGEWLKDLQSSDRSVKYAAALGLESLGANKNTGFAALLAATKSKDPFIRAYVANAIGNFRYNPQLSIPALIGLMGDQDKKVRQLACLAVTKFGSTAIDNLLNAIENDRSPLDEDYPYFGLKDEDLTDYQRKWIKLRRITFYSVFALRLFDSSNVVPKIITRNKLPKPVKSMVYDAFVPGFNPYTYVYYDSSKNDRDFIITLQNSRSQKYMHTANSIKHRDSGFYWHRTGASQNAAFLKAVTERLDSLFKANSEESINEAFCILTNNEYLFSRYKKQYLQQLQNFPDTHARFFCTALYNLGDNGKELMPLLQSKLNENNSFYSPYFYAAIGNMLLVKSIKLRAYSDIVYFNASNPRESKSKKPNGFKRIANVFNPERGFVHQMFSFYDLHFRGMPGVERKETSVQDGLQFEMVTSMEIFEKLFYLDKPMQDTLPNNEQTKNFLLLGLNNKDYRLVCLALSYCQYLSTIPPDIEALIKTKVIDKNQYVQEYAFNLLFKKDIPVKYADNLFSLFQLNREVIEHFHDELYHFFGVEGWAGIAEWGGGTSTFVLPKLPWPPPPASVRGPIDIDGLKRTNQKLGYLYDRLKSQLQAAGFQPDYYRVFDVNGGFALITHLEQTDDKGNPLAKERWSKSIPSPGFFSELFYGKEGYYRSLNFIINPDPNFADNGQLISDALSFEKLYDKGGFELTDDIKNIPLKNAYMHLLVYQFYKKNGGVIRLIRKSENSLSVYDHLKTLHWKSF